MAPKRKNNNKEMLGYKSSKTYAGCLCCKLQNVDEINQR